MGATCYHRQEDRVRSGRDGSLCRGTQLDDPGPEGQGWTVRPVHQGFQPDRCAEAPANQLAPSPVSPGRWLPLKPTTWSPEWTEPPMQISQTTGLSRIPSIDEIVGPIRLYQQGNQACSAPFTGSSALDPY